MPWRRRKSCWPSSMTSRRTASWRRSVAPGRARRLEQCGRRHQKLRGRAKTSRTSGSKCESGCGRVVGVEAGLVPFVGELLAQGEPRLAPVLLAGVGVPAEVVVVVPTLEVLVGADHVEDLVTHVGAQDLRRDAGVVGHRHVLADVVAQRGHHHLGVGAGLLGPGGGLQRVSELVDGEPVGDVAQRLEHGEDLGRHPGLALGGLGADLGPLLGAGLVHPAEAAGAAGIGGGAHGAILALRTRRRRERRAWRRFSQTPHRLDRPARAGGGPRGVASSGQHTGTRPARPGSWPGSRRGRGCGSRKRGQEPPEGGRPPGR